MRIFALILLLSSLTVLFMGPYLARRDEEVSDEWLDKLARDLRTHRGGHWRAP